MNEPSSASSADWPVSFVGPGDIAEWSSCCMSSVWPAERTTASEVVKNQAARHHTNRLRTQNLLGLFAINQRQEPWPGARLRRDALDPQGERRWRSAAVSSLRGVPADAGRGGQNVSLSENCGVHGGRKNKARGQGGSFMRIKT